MLNAETSVLFPLYGIIKMSQSLAVETAGLPDVIVNYDLPPSRKSEPACSQQDNECDCEALLQALPGLWGDFSLSGQRVHV